MPNWPRPCTRTFPAWPSSIAYVMISAPPVGATIMFGELSGVAQDVVMTIVPGLSQPDRGAGALTPFHGSEKIIPTTSCLL